MSEAAEKRDILAEYHALEADPDRKHELLDGVIVAMAGASPRHNELRFQFEALLRAGLASRGCYVASADQRVRVKSAQRYFYPDVVVACPPDFDDDRPRSLTNPRLVVEILSPSTERRDRAAKLDAYREQQGLEDILLVRTNQRLVEHHHRVGESEWHVTLVRAGTVALEELGVALSIDDLYANVDALPTDEDADAATPTAESGTD